MTGLAPIVIVICSANDILVTSAGVRIAGLNHSSSSRQPVQRSLVSASGLTAAQRIYVEVSAS